MLICPRLRSPEGTYKDAGKKLPEQQHAFPAIISEEVKFQENTVRGLENKSYEEWTVPAGAAVLQGGQASQGE